MISTHVLDLVTGQPASNVTVTLSRQENGQWKALEEAPTNHDGRIKFASTIETGQYRLDFKFLDYFRMLKREDFFSEAPVTFNITDTTRNYHIPLLLSTYGYSTYRGS